MHATIEANNEQDLILIASYTRVADIARGKYEGYKTHLLKKWFPITRLKVPAVIGSHSITSRKIMQRWLLQSVAMELGGVYVTPGSAARLYLDDKYGKQKRRVTTNQYHEVVKRRVAPPLYCEPCTMDMGYYVDIKSAYWSIVQILSWDVDYMPSKWLRKGSDMSDFPFYRNKLARNSLVSVGLQGNIMLWDGENPHMSKKPNGLFNMVLWRAVQDVLNGVAYEAVKAGAKYVFTDGFIVDESNVKTVTEVIESWGLPVTIKAQGKTDIQRAGQYKVGSKTTKHYGKGYGRGVNKIYPVDIPWLKKRVRFFAERSTFLY